jgi:RNA polymerase sigma-70 factor (sigma-E family)
MNAQLDMEFRDFMHGRWPTIVRLAYALTGDLGHAEDVAQIAFTRAYASWPRVRRTGNPEAYVRRIVINENRNRFRKQRVAERLTDSPPESGSADTTSQYDERSALIAALQRLGPRQRAVVVLRYWLGLTVPETAAELNCSIGTIKSQASRALASLRESAELVDGGFPTGGPPSALFTATVLPPDPHAPPGLIASGTVNGQDWQLVAGKPGSNGAPRGQQVIQTSGAAFGDGPPITVSPVFPPGGQAPVLFGALAAGPVQVQFGAVQADVSYVTVRLGNGTALTLHPAGVYGARAVAFAIPVGASVVSATAYSQHGEIATAIPFNEPGGTASFGTWLRPGEHGLARSAGWIGSGTYLGGDWSVTAYLGPWGICLEGTAGGTGADSCVDTTSASALHTNVLFWTSGVPAVAGGSAAASVTRIVVTAPDGTTSQVSPVTVGGAKFFAFPMVKGLRPWKWTAYDGSGGVVASSQVVPLS